MCLVLKYGSIVSVLRPRTFAVTPTIFAKQYSERVYNGHCFGRLIGIAVVTVCIKLPPQCFRPPNMVV